MFPGNPSTQDSQARVVVANGCHRFFMYQTALTYQQQGLLRYVLVGWYPKSPWLLRILQSRRFSRLVGARLSQRLLSRRQEGLDPARVVPLAIPDLIERLGRSRMEAALPPGWFSYWSMRAFGSLSRQYVRDLDLFHVRSGYGRGAMEQAKRSGAVCLVDHSIADPRFIEAIMEEEAARWRLPLEFPRRHWECVSQDLDEADHILANSEFVRQTLTASRSISRDRITVLTLGIDLARFFPIEEKPASAPFRILFVGEIGLRKGVLYLLQALQKLRLANAELVMIGGISQIEGLLARNDVRFRHITHVPYEDLVAQYREASVFVFPTLVEGAARVVQEAMACGVPVITTPHAGSIIRDGIDGFLVPIRDVEALRARLLELYNQPERRAAMGREARRAATENFAPERYRDGLLKLHRALTEKP